jgi:hypothetical protein
MNAGEIVKEVRAAIEEGRLSKRRPAFMRPAGSPPPKTPMRYCWPADESVVFVLRRRAARDVVVTVAESVRKRGEDA